MEINPNEISHQSVYKLLTGSILPRPIGWISSVDERGNPNLSPFSFFNAVCSNPPTVVGSDKINLSALKPVERLAGGSYVRVTAVFEMEHPMKDQGITR